MKKILFWGDSPACTTGLGNVSRNVLSGLTDYDISVIGINDRGGWKDPKIYPYKIYPPYYEKNDDIYGVLRLIRTLAGTDKEIKIKPDILFFNADFFILETIKIEGITLLELLNELFRQKAEELKKIPKKIVYTPVDNDIIYANWIDCLNFFDKIIVPTNYGKKVLENYLKKEVEVVYYPLDTENFYSKEVKDKPKDKFVIGYVGRNQWRKDLFRLIYIFALFKRKYKNAFLYLHTQPFDRDQQGWNLFTIANNFGLKQNEDYFIPVDVSANYGKERKEMVDIYNLMDVFFSTSTGEGFGLPYAEASLCEIPVVMPNNTVAYDFKNYVYVYDCGEIHSFGWVDGNRIRPLASVESGLNQLEWVYKNYDLAKKKAKRARDFFLQFSLENQTQEIRKIIEKLDKSS